MIKVWDLWVRIGHWLLVLSIAAAWLTRHRADTWGDALHEWLGYGALAIVALRIVWGIVGSAHARFSDFVFGPRAGNFFGDDLDNFRRLAQVTST